MNWKNIWMSKRDIKDGIVSRTGFNRTIRIHDAAVAADILKREQDFPPHGLVRTMMSGILGRNILSTVGEEWKNTREKAVYYFLGQKIHKAAMPIIDAQIKDIFAAAVAGEAVDGTHTVNVMEMTEDMTLQVIGGLTFGAQAGQKEMELTKAVTKKDAFGWKYFTKLHMGNIIAHGVGLPMLLPVFSRVSAKKLPDTSKDFLALITRYLDEGRVNVDDPQNILDMAVAIQREDGRDPDVRQIFDHVLSFFGAGYFTTAVTTAIAVREVLKNEDVLARVVREARQYSGENLPDVRDIEKDLPEISHAIKETLRLYPPIRGLIRVARVKYPFNDVTIRPNNGVVVDVSKIQRDPSIFAQPDEFKPERFEEKIPSTHYMPFGRGQRVCLGQHIAMAETAAFLLKLFRSYDVELRQDFDKIKSTDMFMVPAGDLLLDITPVV